MKEIFLAGGCYWGTEKYVSSIRGVRETCVGFANGHVSAPTYAQVKHGGTGCAETVRVRYDEQVLPLAALLRLFFRIIDPVSVNRQGEDEGEQYRTGIYWTDPEDGPVVERCLYALQQRYEAPLAVEHLPLASFYPAEEYHQKYLDKNPGGYCHVPFEAIRWVAGIDPLTAE